MEVNVQSGGCTRAHAEPLSGFSLTPHAMPCFVSPCLKTMGNFQYAQIMSDSS